MAMQNDKNIQTPSIEDIVGKQQQAPSFAPQKQKTQKFHTKKPEKQEFPKETPRNAVKFTPLGGIGDVTKNMYAYEYNDDILLVDCGIGFPSDEMLGVDLLIPDTTYLQDKMHKIRGMVLTHGHEDHIGALPYILPTLPKIPVYGTPLTAGLANAKLEEVKLGNEVKAISYKQPIKIGQFTVSFVHITHSIPDSSNIIIKTPIGTFFHAADFKFDLTPVDQQPSDLLSIAEVGREGSLVLLSDCLRVEEKGLTPSEQEIEASFERAMNQCKGKFIVTTFSSNISRLQQAVNVAVRHNRKVCFIGRSMNQAKDVGSRLNFLNIPKGFEIPAEQNKNYKDNQLCFLVAGSQGQENSAMWRIANDEDRFVHIKQGDMVVFSSDPIPGNENAVNGLVDTLAKRGIDAVYSGVNEGLHVSGHGSSSDLMLMMQLTNPKYLIPIGGTFRHMVQYRKLAKNMGKDPKNVFLLEDGQSVIFTKESAQMGGKIPSRNVYVDDMEGTEVGHAIVRDRQKLAEDGMLVIILQYDLNEAKIYGDIDIVSRGFIEFNQNKELFSGMQQEIRKVLSSKRNHMKEWHFTRRMIENELEKFIFRKTRKRPLILPLIVEV